MTERIYYLDALRGILMMGGVLLHAGYVASSGHTWLVSGSGGSIAAYFMVEIIHYFRMPAFFVVSGFFCLMTLHKYGTEKFLSVRLKRIVIPTITTALTLNLLQRIFLDELNSKAFSLRSYFLEGQWDSHLWFLVYLFFYFILAALFYALTPLWLVKRVTAFAIPNPKAMAYGMLLALPCFTLVLQGIDSTVVSLTYDIGGVIDTYQFLYYIQFFIVGYWLYSHPGVMDALVRIDIWKLILTIAVGVGAYALWGGGETYLRVAIAEYTRMLWVWAAVALCLGLFRRYANGGGKTLRYLSEASYTVYLFHHFLVVLIAAVLLHVSTNPLVLLLVTSASAFSIALAIHHFVVRRFDWAAYLFNGKVNCQKQPVSLMIAAQ